ncbi:MAG: hypothetical protein PHY93_14605 [Bacteriovorax sp.]|nr:hypothetical protein [Bacteriovorax sp.]
MLLQKEIAHEVKDMSSLRKGAKSSLGVSSTNLPIKPGTNSSAEVLEGFSNLSVAGN